MFCPKCATQHVDGASFCRSCGANISLVSQALDGKLPAEPATACDEFGFRRKRTGEPSLDHAMRSLMMGIAFAVISVLVSRYSPGGWTWWYWMLIPAAIFFSRGISGLVQLKQTKGQTATLASPQINSVRPTELPVPRTGELMTPVPSVTESTTRHLGAEAQTRHFDSH
jgi:hypothetical protein